MVFVRPSLIPLTATIIDTVNKYPRALSAPFIVLAASIPDYIPHYTIHIMSCTSAWVLGQRPSPPPKEGVLY